MQEILGSLDYLTYWKTGMRWEFFVAAAEKMFVPHIDQEYLDEIRGVAAGARAAGANVSWQEVLAWNGRMELLDYWWPKEKKAQLRSRRQARKRPLQRLHRHRNGDRSATRGTSGQRIVMAHNSWDAFVDVQPFNMIIDIAPASGQRLFMQTAPGCIDSFTDFFITGAGLMGTETTIAGFDAYDSDAAPEFFRVAQGDAVCRQSRPVRPDHDRAEQRWLRQQLAAGRRAFRRDHAVRTGAALLITWSARLTAILPGSTLLRIPGSATWSAPTLSCTDIRDAIGARRVRLAQLMEQYHGRVDVEAAKAIIADHYDVYLKRVNPCCTHDLQPL